MRRRLPGIVALYIGAFLFSAQASETAPAPAAARPATVAWALQLPQDDKLTYRGAVDGGIPGSAGGVLYPGGHPLVFLVSVLTHATIESTREGVERDRRQSSADRVLEPHRTILDTFGHRELAQRALPLTLAPGNAMLIEHGQAQPEGRWLVHGVPVFSLTQDARALRLDHAVEVRAAPAPAEPLYRNIVRVVSTPLPDADHAAEWAADEGRQLKEQSASLLAIAIDIALTEASAAGAATSLDKPFRTVRYAEGGQERMERAQVLEERCGRLLLKNLRGWLMSVPAARAPSAADGACAPAVVSPPATPASAAS